MKRSLIVTLLVCLLAITHNNAFASSPNAGPAIAIENHHIGESITAVANDGDATWVAIESEMGVFSLENSANNEWSHIGGDNAAAYTVSLEADGNGGIWAGHMMSGMSHYSPTSGWSQFHDGLVSAGVSTIAVTGDAVYVGHSTYGTMGQGGGLSTARDNSWSNDMSNPADGLISNNITDMISLPSGEMWLAAGSFSTHFTDYEGGVARYDGTNWMNTSDTLPNRNVNALAVGINGQVFAATASGIYVYNRTAQSWSLYGLNGIRTLDVAVDNAGRIWVATDHGVEVEMDSGNWMVYASHNGLAGDYASQITIGNGNNVWVATDNGLSQIKTIGREATAVTMLANYAAGYAMSHQLQVFTLLLTLVSAVFLLIEVNRPKSLR